MSGAYVPKTAMFIFAHPDDIEFGVAGTAAQWAKAGSRIIYVVITDGNVGSHEADMTTERLAEIRRAEQTAAGEAVGAECIFLGYHDGFLQPTLELRKDLVRLIRQHKPDAVVCPDPTNFFPTENYINHPDHRAAGQVVLDAVFPAAGNVAYFPELLAEGFQPHMPKEVWCSLTMQPNTTLDVTEMWDVKMQAILQHTTQVQEPEKLIERFKSRRAEDSTEENPRYEEKFRVVKYS